MAADRWVWAARPAGASLQAACEKLAAAPPWRWDEGYVSEYCPRLGSWSESVTRALHKGAVLWFDYGLPRAQYYLPERHDGTLLCHFRQRAHADPFVYPGLQDITAWVDFTALAESGAAAGFEVAGFTSQALFLAATGIDREMRAFAATDATLFARLASQARQLMMPGEMGERFKAMAWVRGLGVELSGFSLQDLRHTL
jgi:SAM-dependent MidA family methyltransferase